MKIDFFGTQIRLYFQGKTSHQTQIGQIVTIVIVGIILMRLTFIIYNASQRKDPQVLYQERYVKDPKQFSVTPQNLQLAFGVMDSMGLYMNDSSIFKVTGFQETKVSHFDAATQKTVSTMKRTPFELVQCTTQNFEWSKTKDYFLTQNYTQKYCLDNNLTNLEIEGDYNSNKFSMIYIEFKKCRGEGCKPIEVVDQVLKSTFVDVSFSDIYIDPTDQNNPFSSYARDQYWTTTSDYSGQVAFYFRNNIVESDFGWLFSEKQSRIFPSYSYDTLNVSSEKSDTFLQIMIRMEKAKENYYARIYKNLFNIISEIGGFTQSFIALGTLICLKYSSYHLNQELVNDLFTFENGQNQKPRGQSSNSFNNNKLQDKSCVNNKEQENQNQLNLYDSNLILKQGGGGNLSINQSYISNTITNSHINSNNKFRSPKKLHSTKSPLKLNKNSLEETSNIYSQDDINGQLKIQNRQDSQIPTKNTYQTEKDINGIKVSQIMLQNPKESINMQRLQNSNLNDKDILGKQQSPKNDQCVDKEQQSPNLKQQISQDKLRGSQSFSDKKIIKDIIHSYKLSFLNQNKSTSQINVLKYNQSQQNLSYKERELARQQRIHEEEYKKVTTDNFNLSTIEYIKSIIWPFGRSSRKKQVIEYTMNKLCYHFDIKYIIKKLMEIDKIKKVIFTTDQIKLLEYLPKPTIKYDITNFQQPIDENSSELNSLYQDHRTDLQKAVDAFDALTNITNKKRQNELDNKILSLIDQNLLQALCGQRIQTVQQSNCQN